MVGSMLTTNSWPLVSYCYNNNSNMELFMNA
jgi:hypothetical protein